MELQLIGAGVLLGVGVLAIVLAIFASADARRAIERTQKCEELIRLTVQYLEVVDAELNAAIEEGPPKFTGEKGTLLWFRDEAAIEQHVARIVEKVRQLKEQRT